MSASFEMKLGPQLTRLLNPQLLAEAAAAAVNEGTQYGQQLIMTDTPAGETMQARNSWHVSKVATAQDPSSVLSNNAPHITALEYGSEVGKKPWPGPGPKTTISGQELTQGNVVSLKAPAGMVRKNKRAIRKVTIAAFKRRLLGHD